MKTFKTLRAAAEHAKGGLLIRVKVGGKEIYIAGDIVSTSEIALLQEKGAVARTDGAWAGGTWSYLGHITMRHLARLGNGNWANRGAGMPPFDEKGNSIEPVNPFDVILEDTARKTWARHAGAQS